MTIDLGNGVVLFQDKNGEVLVTRPSIFGKSATHTIKSPYNALAIAMWLMERGDVIQNVFPNMSGEDREFLITGITPKEWTNMFSGDGNE